MLNAKRLQQRLAAIEHYKHKHGLLYARWPHFVMQKMGNNLWRYKFNYAVKGVAAYIVYQEYANYQHLASKTIMTHQEDAQYITNMLVKGGALGAICLLC